MHYIQNSNVLYLITNRITFSILQEILSFYDFRSEMSKTVSKCANISLYIIHKCQFIKLRLTNELSTSKHIIVY